MVNNPKQGRTRLGNTNNVFPKAMQRPKASKIETATLKGFGGGWNAVDDDYSMAPRFAKVLKNTRRTTSGSQKVRYGTGFFVDIKPVRNSPIVDEWYFNGRLVICTESGHILTVTDAGLVAEIWNSTIAAALPGAPSTWTGSVVEVTFVPFKDKLVIHNGKDKPVEISSSFAVTYLQDQGTGSNVNVPIGKYACVAANYHCVAGVSAQPTTIYISSQGTDGTFVGDPAPNDAITLDVGAYAPEGAAAIRGMLGYRSYLIVFLQGISIQISLGTIDGSGLHTPQFPDTFPKFGLTSDRCMTTVENDLVYVGVGGLSTAKRNIYSTTLQSEYLSNFIEPEYRRILGALTNDQLLLNTFSVYDPLARDFMIFVPGGQVLVYSSNEKLGYKAWSLYEGMDWTSGCTSFLGRVFLSKGTKLFQMGNATFGEEYFADRVNDRDYTWTNNINVVVDDLVWDNVGEQSYKVLVDHTTPLTGTFAEDLAANPTVYEEYNGEAIDFEIEMPWFNGRDEMRTKKMEFVSATTRGTAEFTIECYVDNFYKDVDGNVIYDPALSITMIGNDAPGFGVEGDDVPFGGGRRSRDARLIKFPAKFKSAKFRVFGSVRKPLELVTFSFLFARGKYFR